MTAKRCAYPRCEEAAVEPFGLLAYCYEHVDEVADNRRLILAAPELGDATKPAKRKRKASERLPKCKTCGSVSVLDPCRPCYSRLTPGERAKLAYPVLRGAA